jgi:acyl dehydratase
VSELTLAGLNERIGQDFRISDSVAIDQGRIDAFASCTSARQRIHVDIERAKRESPLGSPIAHGYLTLAMVAPLAMQVGVIPKDAAAGLNYGIDKVRFLAPVPAAAARRSRWCRAQGICDARHMLRGLARCNKLTQPICAAGKRSRERTA